MRFAFHAEPRPTLPVAGGDAVVPVRRIYCVGRNYAAHAREMGHDPEREAPFFFMKPGDAVVPSGETLPFPPQTEDLQHEIELVAVIGRAGAELSGAHALDHVYGYAVGLDMTRRDLQAQAKALRRPWDMGKGFDHSCPCSAVAPASEIGHPERGAIRLRVNGGIRQQSDLSRHIWTVPEIIASLSRLVRLAPGDLILTGTPEGVAAVRPGDVLEGHIDGVGDLEIRYAPR